MNIHHLELFYFVARYGGITEAVRNIPYGIQQPAVSGQVAQLEEYLGVTLFQRRPFALTPAGQKLFAFIEPFFSKLDVVATELQGGTTRQIRIGASGIVLRDHLPELLQQARRKFPKLKVGLREGYQAELELMLQRGDIDLAITILEKKSNPGVHSMALLELPLVLLVEEKSPYTSAEQLWAKDRIEEPLICLPAHEGICKNFQQGLLRAGVDWFPSIEVSSLDLLEAYVAGGFGIGLSVLIPLGKTAPGLRMLPLPGFAPVGLGVLWRGKPTTVLQTFLDEMQAKAKRLIEAATAGLAQTAKRPSWRTDAKARPQVTLRPAPPLPRHRPDAPNL